MTSPLISIIVPVYNTGELLRYTVKSILAQSYSSFELLLIDDGSCDETALLCNKLKETDERIRVFHNENAGICGARNFGLMQVKGEFLAFCDHDDLFMPYFLEYLLKIMIAKQVDVVKCCYYLDNENSSFNAMPYYKEQVVYTGDSLDVNFYTLMRNGIMSNVWNGLYRTSVLKQSGELFDTKFKHGGEDFDFNIRLFQKIGSLCVVPNLLYTHIVRKELSTSAKLYDDILWNFVNEIEKISAMSKINKIPYNDANYVHWYIKRLIAFLSYAARMKKKSEEIDGRIELFYKHFNSQCAVPVKKYLKEGADRKERISTIVYFFFLKKRISFVYRLAQILKS